MTKLFVGILKGLVIGGALGFGAHALGQSAGFYSPWLTFGVIGALCGLLVGKPIWRLVKDAEQTSWIGVIKAAFGFGVGCGLYALLAKVWGPSPLLIDGFGDVFAHPATVGGAIGAIYGGFVELDDGIGDPPKQIAAKSKAK